MEKIADAGLDEKRPNKEPIYDAVKRIRKIGDTAKPRRVSCIEAKDGVLWVLSDKKLLRLHSSGKRDISDLFK